MVAANLALAAAAAGAAWLVTRPSKGGANANTIAGHLCTAPNGALMICADEQPHMMSALATSFVTPAPSSGAMEPAGTVHMTLSRTPMPGSTLTPTWVLSQVSTGRIVMIAVDGRQELLSTPLGSELILCPVAKPQRNAVLVEPNLAPNYQNQPAIFTPGQAIPNTPFGPIPNPFGPPPPAAPGQAPPPQNPFAQPTFNTPLGPMANPFAMPAPAPTPGPAPSPGPMPGPSSPPPSAPPFQIPGLQATPPAGWPQGIPWPGGPPAPGQPAVIPPSSPAAPFTPPAGATVYRDPSDGLWRHVIRQGDIASQLAQSYAGDASRWKELGPMNGLSIVNDGSGQALGFSPWRLGQVLKLPSGWDASRGPAQLYSAPSSPQGGGGLLNQLGF